MRGVAILLLALTGCPAPTRYAIERPGLGCDRALRVAHRTMIQIGYTVTDMVPPGPSTPGLIEGTKVGPDGERHRDSVRITCNAAGATLQPVEEGIVPNYEFSRMFGYSFKSLVQRPDVEEPSAARGLQVQVRVIDSYQARLDLGGVPTAAGAVPVRVTVRNDTDRAVAISTRDIDLVRADGSSVAPLEGPSLDAALAPGAAGDQVRTDLLATARVAPHTVVIRWVVFPAGTYREARVSITDVETDETEGFVTPVE